MSNPQPPAPADDEPLEEFIEQLSWDTTVVVIRIARYDDNKPVAAIANEIEKALKTLADRMARAPGRSQQEG